MSDIPMSKMFPGLALLVLAAVVAGLAMLGGDDSCFEGQKASSKALVDLYPRLVERTKTVGAYVTDLSEVGQDSQVEGYDLVVEPRNQTPDNPAYTLYAKSARHGVVIAYTGEGRPRRTKSSGRCD